MAVLLAVLALVAGLRTAFAATGDPLHVLVMRKGGNAELTSVVRSKVSRSSNRFRASRKVRTGSRSRRLKIVSVINLTNPDSPNGMNVTLRGLSQVGIRMRHVKITEGRWFTPGKREVVVGKTIEKRYPDAQIGKQLRFGKGSWTVVGVMDGGQSAYNSEIWGDANQVASDFNRPNA